MRLSVTYYSDFSPLLATCFKSMMKRTRSLTFILFYFLSFCFFLLGFLKWWGKKGRKEHKGDRKNIIAIWCTDIIRPSPTNFCVPSWKISKHTQKGTRIRMRKEKNSSSRFTFLHDSSFLFFFFGKI